MEPIFSMTTLQRTPALVKEAAANDVVRITEQGMGAYIFCSESAFEQRIARERAEAAYEARLTDAVARGIADIEHGKYYTDIDEAFQKASELRHRHV